MARITRVVEHLALEDVKARMRNDPNPFYRERWSIIYTAQVHPREAKDIANDMGVSVSKVHTLIPRYNKMGVAAVETKGKGGRHREYITFKEEQNLLAGFFERAAKGELVTAREIKREYEKVVRHKVAETTIYRILKKHKWRKVMPRSRHPKANTQKQKELKENFQKLIQEQEKTKNQQDNRPTIL